MNGAQRPTEEEEEDYMEINDELMPLSPKSPSSVTEGGEVEECVILSIGNGTRKVKRAAASVLTNSKKAKVVRSLSVAQCQALVDSGTFGTIPKQAARAEYWKFFDVVTDELLAPLPFIRCKKCKKVLARAENAGSTAFDQHAKRCVNASGSSQQTTLAEFSVKKVSTEGRRVVSRACALFCAMDARPFTTVAGIGFRHLLSVILRETAKTRSLLLPEDLLPCPKTVSHYVKLEAETLRKKQAVLLAPLIRQFGGSCTLDFWKEPQTKIDYLSCTYHFIDADWSFQKRLLYCAEYDSTYQKTAERVRNFIFERLGTFGLTEDICSGLQFITDGGLNMVNAFSVPQKAKLQRTTCAGHQLNTALANFFNRKKKSKFLMPASTQPIWDLLTKAKELVAHTNQTGIAREMKGHKLVQSVETRWNTKLDMIDSILKEYGLLEILLRERGELNMLPGPQNLLHELAQLLAPFKSATLAVSYDKEPTINHVAPHFVLIMESFQNLVPSDHPAMAAFQKHCKRVLDAKLPIQEIHQLGVFFDPSMKDLTQLFTRTEANAILKRVRQMLPTAPVNVREEPQPPLGLPIGTDKFRRFAETEPRGVPGTTAKDDVDVYLSYNPPPKGQSILEFWKAQEKVLPGLAAAARRVLSIVASSTSSERLFSHAGNVVTDKRTGLNSDKLDDLLYLMWNHSSDKN